MFREHQPQIQAWARRDARNFAHVATFVLATVREPLERAVEHAQDASEGNLEGFWGFKMTAALEFQRLAGERLERLEALPDRDARLAEAASWYGFGPVKGGFLLQLTFGESGCLDGQNVKRLNLDLRRFAAYRFKALRTERSRTARIREYHALVDACGGTEALWDDWCRFVAAERPSRWGSAREVSEAHMLATCGANIPF